MRKLLFVPALFLMAFGLMLASPIKKTLAQSPIRCGLFNEPCCTGLVGGEENPCQTGLICQEGRCVALPTTSNPPIRGGITPSTTNTPNCDPRGGEPGTGIDTAIGCIPVGDTNAFIGFILRWAIGIGGGIAFLLIVYAAFMIITSQGNPERLKAGQELLTSAIAGLIMLIFSVFILRVIGVNILGIFE